MEIDIGKSHPSGDFRLQYLRSFKFEDLTFRGTVEFRSVCEQPVGEIMASGALHAGLMENIGQLSEILEKDTSIYHNGYNASELRRMFNRRRKADIFDWKKVSTQFLSILELAGKWPEKERLRRRTFPKTFIWKGGETF